MEAECIVALRASLTLRISEVHHKVIVQYENNHNKINPLQTAQASLCLIKNQARINLVI